MKNMLTKYLFCYFTGNEPENESIHFAVSDDGFHFTALNHNKPVITQTLGKKCCRDPFILRNKNGRFHIIATDMRCHDGWNSNNSFVVWDSENLTDWNNERILDFSKMKGFEKTDRAWAPEALFDKAKNEYMLYWSHHRSNVDDNTVIWYAYTKDFKSFTTKPAVLFRPESKMDGIDADIIEHNGKFYLYYKDEFKKTICYAESSNLSGPYEEPNNNRIAVTDCHVEGNCIYRITGTNDFVMIMDKYVDGGYFMQKTQNMTDFEKIDESSFSLNHLTPRHGSVLHITDEEYQTLLKFYN